MQNMENQSFFDLEKALLEWKQDCASRPGVSSDDARELESHLRDCVAELRMQGMSGQQAFHAGLRQVGPTPEIAQEFAKENPLGLWRDRLFWIVTAALACGVWFSASFSPLWWVERHLGTRLLFPCRQAWYFVFGYLPVLVVGALLATGRLGRAREWLRRLMQSRPRFACAGAMCIIASALLMQISWFRQYSWPQDVLLFLHSSLWPTILLAIGTALLRPLSSARWAGSAADPAIAAASVWRDRVFWMAAGALLTLLWQGLDGLGLTALFLTGDTNRPFVGNPLALIGFQLLMLLGPVVVAAGLVLRHIRRGRSLLSDVAPARQSMFVLVAVMLCAWAAVNLWITYLRQPYYLQPQDVSLYSQMSGRVSWRWGRALMAFASNLQWLWPAGLGVLAVCLAPVRRETREGPQPIPA